MSRQLEQVAYTKMAQKLGTEPITIIEIVWSKNNSTFYADRDILIDSNLVIPGKIITISRIDEIITLDSRGTTASVSIELDDTDGVIKKLWDSNDLHKLPCNIYQWYEGLDLNKKFLLLEALVMSPITWKEGNRSISFELMTKTESNEVGFAPEEGYLPYVEPRYLGKVWPLCFGSPIHVPTTIISDVATGSISTFTGIPDQTIPVKMHELGLRVSKIEQAIRNYCQVLYQDNLNTKDPTGIVNTFLEDIKKRNDLKQKREDLALVLFELNKMFKVFATGYSSAPNSDTQARIFRDAGSVSMVSMITSTTTAGSMNGGGGFTWKEAEDYLKNALESALVQAGADSISDPPTGDITAFMKPFSDAITDYRARLEQSNKDYYNILWQLKADEIDAHNVKYWSDACDCISKELKKLYDDYNQADYQLFIFQAIIAEEDTIFRNQVTVVGYENFRKYDNSGRVLPAEPIEVLINGARFLGIFENNGNVFTMLKALPTYTALVIGSASPDSFTISDPTINLSGLWCCDGLRIFKIREQIGQECYVDPVEMKAVDVKLSQEPNQYDIATLDSFTIDELTDSHYYTLGEQQKMIDDAIDSSSYGPQIQAAKDMIDQITSILNGTPSTSEYEIRVRALTKEKENYSKLLKKALKPISVEDESKRQCAKDELDTIVQLKQLAFIKQFRSDHPQLPTMFTGPAHWIRGNTISGAIQACPYIPPEWVQPYYSDIPMEYMHNGVISYTNIRAYLPSTGYWIAQPGASFKSYMNWQEKHVCNILPSNVLSVFAYKGNQGVRTLEAVPRNYYIINGNENFGNYLTAQEELRPLNVTTISMVKPLSDYVGEGWEGKELYVTLQSPVGPNVVDIIEWLIATYTDWTCDPISFNHVKTTQTQFPANFALLQKRSVIELINQIAWQARCAVVVSNKVAKIVFLAETPKTDIQITESDVLFDTFEITTTSSEELVTKLIATWRPDYRQEYQGTPIQEVIRYNTIKYGVCSRTYDFFIYNQRSLVVHSATFWSMRLANTWKKVKFETPLNHLNLQSYDSVILNINPNHFSNAPISVIVDKLGYDSDKQTLAFECWLPVRSGEMNQYKFAWPSGLTVQDIYPELWEIQAGYAGNPHMVYVSQQPGGSGGEINVMPPVRSGNPSTYGDINIGDVDSPTVSDPTSSFVQQSRTIPKRPQANRDVKFDEATDPDALPVHDKATFDSETEKELAKLDAPGSSKSFVGTVKMPSSYGVLNEYWVTRPNGMVTKAVCMNLKNDQVLPAGMLVDVTYDEGTHQYIFNVDVWGSLNSNGYQT